MQKYAIALTVPGTVQNTVYPLEGFTIEQCFSADIRATMYPCGDDVEQDWTYDGSAFAAPVPYTPTEEELYNAERAAVERKYSAPWNGANGGVLTLLQMTIVAAIAAGQDTADLYTQYNDELAAMNAEFTAIDGKYGVA